MIHRSRLFFALLRAAHTQSNRSTAIRQTGPAFVRAFSFLHQPMRKHAGALRHGDGEPMDKSTMHYISDHCLHCGGTAFRPTQSHLTYCLVCGVLFKRPPPTQLALNLTTRIST